MTDAAVVQAKRDMRQSLLTGRVDMARATPDAGMRVRNKFQEHLHLPPGVTVAGFWPMGAEIDPRPTMMALAAAGHRLALPVVVAARTALAFRAWQPGDPLVAAGFGTSVPPPSAAPVVPDVLIVPLLAFDRRGFRLGYGGGFYDRTIAALEPRLRLTVGVAFAAQEVARVPTDHYDKRLDHIVTEREVIACAAGEKN